MRKVSKHVIRLHKKTNGEPYAQEPKGRSSQVTEEWMENNGVRSRSMRPKALTPPAVEVAGGRVIAQLAEFRP